MRVSSKPDKAAEGLGPEFLEANSPGPTPGRFTMAPAAAAPPGQSNPDPPQPEMTPADAGAGAAGSGSGSSEPSRWTTPTAVKSLRSSPFESVARGLMRAIGGLLNRRFQVDDTDTSFLPDSDDDVLIAKPAGRIAARHLPLPDKADLSELEDIGAAVVGLLTWASKGLISAWDARATRRRGRAVARGTGAAVYAGGPGEEEEQQP